MSKNLFVYGTLMYPEVIHLLTGKTFKNCDAYCENYKTYQIFDDGIPRVYPALFPCKGEVTMGEIFFDVDKSSQEIIDVYEDVGYEKGAVSVRTEVGIIEAETYVWKDKLKHKLDSEWDEKNFRENELTEYVKNLKKSF